MTRHNELTEHLKTAFEEARTDFDKLADEIEEIAVPIPDDLENVRERVRHLMAKRTIYARLFHAARRNGKAHARNELTGAAMASAADVPGLLARLSKVDV